MAAILSSIAPLETAAPPVKARPDSAPPAASAAGRSRRAEAALRGLGWGLASLLLAGLVGGWWVRARAHVVTDNAYVAGNIHQVSPRIAGVVLEVLVDDNQRVSAGQPLFKLDPRDFQLRVEQARTQLTQASAHLAQAAAQLQQAQAQRAQGVAKSAKAAAELERARLDYERAQRLTEGGQFAAISKQEFDSAKAAFEVAQATAQVSEAELESSAALVDAGRAAHELAQAQQRNAQVALADAELQLSYLTIPAPVAGTVGRKTIEVGQRLQPGQAVLAVVADQKWVVANFKETQLARMQAGQRVVVRIDAIPGQSFAGWVESFSPASGAQFALLPPDNATGNFTKIVQRVPVKIVFDRAQAAAWGARIMPGLSAAVEVKIGSKAL